MATSIRRLVGGISFLAFLPAITFIGKYGPSAEPISGRPIIDYFGLVAIVIWISAGLLGKLLMVSEGDSKKRPSVVASYFSLWSFMAMIILAGIARGLQPRHSEASQGVVFAMTIILVGMPVADILNIWDVNRKE